MNVSRKELLAFLPGGVVLLLLFGGSAPRVQIN